METAETEGNNRLEWSLLGENKAVDNWLHFPNLAVWWEELPGAGRLGEAPSKGGGVNWSRDSQAHGVSSGKPGKGRKEEKIWKGLEISEHGLCNKL